MKTVDVLVDGQVVQVESKPLGVIVHDGEMNVEVPSYFLIGPEKTIDCANTLPTDQWAQVRANENFLKFWGTMYPDSVPPENLAKASLAVRHSVGMILLLCLAKTDKLHVHLQYPETYLHPKQAARVVLMLKAMGFGGPDA